jgi:ubiquinone/menaquinone biosynthesis C-methylase UbiE
MLRRAETRAQQAGIDMQHLRFVLATLPGWHPPDESFDAVVTHFFLDCFPPDELHQVTALLARALRPASRWLIADFAVPDRGWKRHRAAAMHRLMYAFFRRMTKIRAERLTAPDPLLAAHGFKLAGRKTLEWGLLHSDFWQRGDTNRV